MITSLLIFRYDVIKVESIVIQRYIFQARIQPLRAVTLGESVRDRGKSKREGCWSLGTRTISALTRFGYFCRQHREGRYCRVVHGLLWLVGRRKRGKERVGLWGSNGAKRWRGWRAQPQQANVLNNDKLTPVGQDVEKRIETVCVYLMLNSTITWCSGGCLIQQHQQLESASTIFTSGGSLPLYIHAQAPLNALSPSRWVCRPSLTLN